MIVERKVCMAILVAEISNLNRLAVLQRAIVARVARYKSVDSKIFWKKKLEPSVKEKWELFFDEPNKW